MLCSLLTAFTGKKGYKAAVLPYELSQHRAGAEPTVPALPAEGVYQGHIGTGKRRDGQRIPIAQQCQALLLPIQTVKGGGTSAGNLLSTNAAINSFTTPIFRPHLDTAGLQYFPGYHFAAK